MRSPQNVLESLKSKAANANYHYQRLYRNLYNPEFYLLAYQRIQAKQGNMTAGTDGKTIDGMGMRRIENLIETKVKNSMLKIVSNFFRNCSCAVPHKLQAAAPPVYLPPC